ncbi:MAG: hypothetical protein JNL60_18785, partial [Bacteroidia bacterium]|nr:hypothetical protein [Bacteroidia bacterium]
FSCFGVVGQNLSRSDKKSSDLDNICTGSAHAFNEMWEVYPKTKIGVKNLSTGRFFNVDAVVMSDVKSQYTAVSIKVSENLAVVFGYAPGLSGQNYDGYGEMIFFERRDGDVNKLLHVYEMMEYFPANNEKIYYLDKGGMSVYVKDRVEVSYFQFDKMGFSYFLPKNYFEYK